MSQSTRKRTLKILEQNGKKDGTQIRGAIRDLITDLMHICVEEGIDIHTVFENANEVFEEEAEKCGQFCHADVGDGLTICEEPGGTEHSHHDGDHKCRTATPEEEAACRAIWDADKEGDTVVHLKNGRVVDLSKEAEN